MRKWKKSLLAVVCCLTATAAVGAVAACDNAPPPGTQNPAGTQLVRPVAYCVRGVVSWSRVVGASGYAYKINGGEEQYTTLLSVTIEEGQTIQVKALGGDGYTDSEWSNAVSYILASLSAPVLSSDGSTVTWTAVEGASGYVYRINGGTEQETNGTSLTLQDGDRVVVKAKGDYITTADSNWSMPLVYEAPYEITVNNTMQAAGTVEGAGAYAEGDTVTLTATAEKGYAFAGWYVGGQLVSSNPTYSFAVTGDVTVEAAWTKLRYQVTVSSQEGGSATGGTEVEYEEEVTVVATADEGYTFAGWYKAGDLVSSSATYTFTVTDAVVLEARWTINTYTVSVTSKDESQGTVVGTDTYDHGETATVVATAKDGYVFAGWYKAGNLASSSATYTFTVTEDVALEAQWKLDVSVVSVTAQTGGSVTGADTYRNGREATVVATADDGYLFLGWYKAGNLVSSAATYTFTVTEDVALEARFRVNNVEVSVSSQDGGSVSGGGTFEWGASVTVTATPDAGYTFLGWFLGGVGVSVLENYTFDATQDIALEARWELNTYTVTIEKNIEEAGTVTGAGTYDHGESGTVTATTNAGYTFLGWFEGTTELTTSESYTITSLTSDRTLTAKWEAIACVLTLDTDFDIAGTLTGAGEYAYKETVQLKATPASNMYTFLGWYDSEDNLLSSSPSFLYQITEDTTIKAEWEDGWKAVEGYNYWTMAQHGQDVMPIVGFNSPNAATVEISQEVANVHGSYPSQINDHNYQMMKDAGINTIVGWWNDWTNGQLQDDILQELDLADKYGISYIVTNRNSLYVNSASELSEFSSYMDKPAYGGTILIDEPGAVNFVDIGEATRAWENSKYSNTLAYVNMLPNYAAGWQLNDCQGTGGTYTGEAYNGYEQWIQRYLSISKPQVFSYDHYPYLFTQPTFFRDGWYTNLSNVRYWTMKANVPYWVYGQLGGWPGYGQVIDENTQHLTYGHTALQFNSMLSYGAKGIQYYNYFMPPNYIHAGNYTSAVMADGSPTPFYEQIQKINKQVSAAGTVLLRSAWRGVIQINNSPAPISSGDLVSSYGALTGATGVGDAIVGCFEYRDIGYAYYVTTNNVYNASTVTLNFNDTYALEKVQDGITSTSTVSSITLSIPAGEGVLVVVPKN